ncbi:hypothetical protein PHLCEN_2v8777 [Hermanssonia centrifuga]|uniref:Uncharacterized protein n=1 Tax=Hermanssonia centrifuga TaxID=98765 RepID=A0A2R6NT91_9APHY|nr:hypothetical protein PHLCEN_2v8777 [Hermanssonia centrifuga]
MASHEEPQDEPFNHTAITRHSRGESTTNLLHSSEQSGYEPPEHAHENNDYDSNLYDKPDELDYSDKHTGGTEVRNYQDLEYGDDPFDESRARPLAEKATPLSRLFANVGNGKVPVQQRIEEKKRGIGRQKYPFVAWTLAVVMLGVFIYELVLNSRAQGTPISMKPVVNPMLGPSQSALINAGARFPPCMKEVQGLPQPANFPCLNDTANPPDQICSLEDICGFGGFHGEEPDQWFRLSLKSVIRIISINFDA